MRSAFQVRLIAAVMFSLLFRETGEAAGVFCGDPVESGLASGVTKAEAEAAAISWWSSRAGASGRGYEIWAHARDPEVTCKEGGNGKFTCRARARPCLPVGQTPENLPKLDL